MKTNLNTIVELKGRFNQEEVDAIAKTHTLLENLVGYIDDNLVPYSRTNDDEELTVEFGDDVYDDDVILTYEELKRMEEQLSKMLYVYTFTAGVKTEELDEKEI